jgi:protein O-GlcNAc transferase
MTQSTLDLAKMHLQAGRLPEAQQACREILAKNPQHPDALHLMGIIAMQSGDPGQAADWIRRAAAADPSRADFLSNLGLVLIEAGRPADAIAPFQSALKLRPDLVQAHNNLGVALESVGRLQEAEASLNRALEINPDYADAWCNLGSVMIKQSDPDRAIAVLQKAIALQPNFPEAHHNLSGALRAKNLLDESAAAARAAIAQNPNYAEAHDTLGTTLQMQEKFSESAAEFRQALRIRPNFAQAAYNLGNTLRESGELDAAIAAFNDALRLDPNYAQAHNNLGIALAAANRRDEAIAAFRKALELQPNLLDSWNNLASNLLDTGRIDEAIAAYQKALDLRPDHATAGSNLAYALNFHSEMTAQTILRKHLDWNDLHVRPLRSSIRPHDNSRDPNRKLRIGYVSPDFRRHVVGRNILPLVREHDRNQFEVFCYSTSQRHDDFTNQFSAASEGWRNIAKFSDESAAQMIREDRIDILVDLALHMSGSRLLIFARKPAPVQATFGGYPGTTGVETIDYRLTDPYLDPLSSTGSGQGNQKDADYSEQTIRLAHSFWCYDAAAWELSASPAVNELPALSSGRITFGCLNNFCKTNDKTLFLWAKVLDRIPSSRLLLLSPQGEHRRHVREKLFDRVDFAEFQPRQKYLEIYNRIDLGLDTFPYNGHTTSLDSLWMGVPVISLAGKTAASRAGFSQAGNLGLADELVAQNTEQFVNLASRWATDLPRLSELRRNLRRRMQQSPLMDSKTWTASIESAYRNIWTTWCGRKS